MKYDKPPLLIRFENVHISLIFLLLRKLSVGGLQGNFLNFLKMDQS